MYIVTYVTCKNLTEAKKVSKKLLDKKLIACVNIIKDIQSLFWWQGKLDTAKEVMLVAKAKKKDFKEIVALVKKVHSYEVPEIIALPIIEGNPQYLDWINKSTKKT